MRTVEDPTLEAELTWTTAARGAAVDIVELDDWARIEQAASLLARIWDRSEANPPLNTDLLRALTHSGNYAAGAVSDGELVAAIVGFFGSQDGHRHLHSHILGVAPEMRSRNVGFAMKQHQRHWCLRRGVDTVTWTFDPLVRRNAYFNVSRLGAEADTYLRNFYGSMDDGINKHDESDRLLVVWRLDSPRAIDAASRNLPAPDLDEGSVATILDVGADGGPVRCDGDADVLVCRVPEDIVALRSQAPDVSAHWRRALRATLGDAMDAGYRVAGFLRTGSYILQR